VRVRKDIQNVPQDPPSSVQSDLLTVMAEDKCYSSTSMLRRSSETQGNVDTSLKRMIICQISKLRSRRTVACSRGPSSCARVAWSIRWKSASGRTAMAR
jgi:hypothetical protein